MSNSPQDKLTKLDQQIAQLKARKQRIQAQENAKARKARTRRLIQNGALAEQYLQCENIDPEEFKKRLEQLVKLPGVSAFLAGDLNKQ